MIRSREPRVSRRCGGARRELRIAQARFNGSRLLRVSLLSVLVAAALAPMGQANGHDHDPPRAVVDNGQQMQRGILSGFCWQRTETYFCGDGNLVFPSPVAVAQRAVAIALKKLQPPHEFHVVAWRRLRNEHPVGQRSSLACDLLPGLVGARVEWTLRCELPEGPRRHYLLVNATWVDEEGSPRAQSASWTFTLRRDNSPSSWETHTWSRIEH